MSCVILKANIQLYFVNVSVQRRKAVCVGCVVYLDELVIIGLGIRIRQGFAGGGITGRISQIAGFIQR